MQHGCVYFIVYFHYFKFEMFGEAVFATLCHEAKAVKLTIASANISSGRNLVYLYLPESVGPCPLKDPY